MKMKYVVEDRYSGDTSTYGGYCFRSRHSACRGIRRIVGGSAPCGCPCHIPSNEPMVSYDCSALSHSRHSRCTGRRGKIAPYEVCKCSCHGVKIEN